MSSKGGKPRLLVLTSTFPRWPDDHEPPFVFELSRRLTERFDVTVLAPHAPGAKNREVMDGIQVHRFRYAPERFERLAYDGGIPHKLRNHPWLSLLVPLFLLSQTVSTIRLLRQLRPQAIHAHWLLPQGLIALFARQVSGIKARLVVTAHGADIHGLNSRFAKWLKRRVVSGADAITVVSRALAREARSLTTDPDKIRVIPMGVDLRTRFVPGPPRPRGKTLVFAGRLVEKKGVSTLLEAMALLLPDEPDCRLLIAGFGPLRESLEAQAHALGLDGKVEFLGSYRNQDLPAIFHRADIAVYPFIRAAGGDQEGLGLVIVEAMGCGLPVVTSDLPAIHDVIADGKTGVLVSPQDPDGQARAIGELLEDDQYADRLSRAGRTFAIEHFDWENTSSRYADLLLVSSLSTEATSVSVE